MTNLIDILLEDHEELRNLFEQYPDDCQKTFVHLQRDLTVHTKLEEQCLYPVMRQYDEAKVNHAQKEHDEAKELLAQLAKDPTNLDIMKELKKGVLHHVTEEEQTDGLFDEAMGDLGKDKLDEIGKQAAAVKEELLAEYK